MNRKQKIAILKPDHLGDLVLSVPAVSKVLSEFDDVTLLCSPYTLGLARTLWPEKLNLRAIRFPHLTKAPAASDAESATPNPVSSDFDWVLSLRHDSLLQRWIDRGAQTRSLMPRFTNDLHESRIQQDTLYRVVGPYSRSQHAYRRAPLEFPIDPKRIGLCLSSGFSANRWPLWFWRELGQQLINDKRSIRLIGGPNERGEVTLLANWLGLPASSCIVGGGDFSAFLDQVQSSTDVVISADSGTAHLCSLVRPILSIFGPSPFRRYAPFGTFHRVLTFDLTCSPCSQFDKSLVNLCLSRECVQAILPRHVLDALFIKNPSQLPGVDRTSLPNGLALFYGVSHLPEPFWPTLPQTTQNQFKQPTTKSYAGAHP